MEVAAGAGGGIVGRWGEAEVHQQQRLTRKLQQLQSSCQRKMGRPWGPLLWRQGQAWPMLSGCC